MFETHLNVNLLLDSASRVESLLIGRRINHADKKITKQDAFKNY